MAELLAPAQLSGQLIDRNRGQGHDIDRSPRPEVDGEMSDGFVVWRFHDGHERARSFELGTPLDASSLIAEMSSGASASRSAAATLPFRRCAV